MEEIVNFGLLDTLCYHPLGVRDLQHWIECSAANAQLLIDHIQANDVDLSAWCTHPHASRLLSTLIEQLSTATEQASLLKLVSCLSSNLSLSALMDDQAAEIVCKLIELKLPCSSMEFMATTLRQNFMLLASHTCSARLILTFLGAYGNTLNSQFWHDILAHSKQHGNDTFLHLCQLQHSHTIVLQLIECDMAGLRQVLVEKVVADKRVFLRLSESEYGCKIVQLCIKLATTTQIAALVSSVMENEHAIYHELRLDAIGCAVVNSLVAKCDAISRLRDRKSVV